MDNSTDTSSCESGLDCLSISGFRGIAQLDIPHLGRVCLLAGKNGVGKTTVLEALRVYASRGRLRALREILSRRDEWTSFSDGNQGDKEVPALDRLFHQQKYTTTSIVIGPASGGPVFKIENIEDLSAVPSEVADHILDSNYAEEYRVLRVAFGAMEHFYVGQDMGKLRQCKGGSHGTFGSSIRCRWLGPQMISNIHLARLWDEVVRENLDSLALDAVRLVYGSDVERAPVMVGDSSRQIGRRALVKLRQLPFPVPLRSLGDGTTRILSVALALATCRDGILLLDEAENGVHYSLHKRLWGMIFRVADEHNVQVIATTHSKDCVNGFAGAALECPIEANLVRIGWRNGELRAVEYSTEELQTAAEQNIEVR